MFTQKENFEALTQHRKMLNGLIPPDDAVLLENIRKPINYIIEKTESEKELADYKPYSDYLINAALLFFQIQSETVAELPDNYAKHYIDRNLLMHTLFYLGILYDHAGFIEGKLKSPLILPK